MSAGRKGNGHSEIVEELKRLAAQTQDDPSNWREIVLSLRQGDRTKSAQQRSEGLLRAMRAMRDAGVMEADEAHWAVSLPIIQIAEDRIYVVGESPALDALSRQMRDVAKAHGLADDEDWPKGEGPEENERLRNEWERLCDEIMAQTFDEYGEPELGNMYRHHYPEFDERYERGRLAWKRRSK